MLDIIRKVAKENNIPLNISMFSAVRENILRVFCENEITEKMVLMSEADTLTFVNSGCWDKLRNEPVTYEIIKNEVNSEKLEFLEKTIKNILNEAFEICEITAEKNKGEIGFDLCVGIESYHVPIRILIRIVETVREVEIQGIDSLFSDKKYKINKYPKDEALVENLIEIMDKLELISSLESYDATFRFLQRESIEGRRIKPVFERGLKNKGLSEKEARLGTIAAYKNYPYMKKKWNKYLKTTGRKDPEWSVVVTTISNFMEPLVESIVNDTVFFSDWMPELQRYLD